ncbi:MAG: hypothetical protein F6K45_21515 [Kamptonema sp. SIO1D9]|nr:hypothetical protein [Kamptonema sp. SIO1D9]
MQGIAESFTNSLFGCFRDSIRFRFPETFPKLFSRFLLWCYRKISSGNCHSQRSEESQVEIVILSVNEESHRCFAEDDIVEIVILSDSVTRSDSDVRSVRIS